MLEQRPVGGDCLSQPESDRNLFVWPATDRTDRYGCERSAGTTSEDGTKPIELLLHFPGKMSAADLETFEDEVGNI